MNLIHLLLLLLLFFLNITFGDCLSESEIRDTIFVNYNKNSLPVIDDGNIILKYGLEIKNLVFFNQKSENIKLTIENTLQWQDDYLKWNISDNSPQYITIYNNSVWLPDLELYNAASKPEVFEKNPPIKIYNDGKVELIEHISYSFACKLDLTEFPYDTQTCNMIFGSWKYPKHILDIVPFNETDIFKNFTVSSDFSHNEWVIENIQVSHQDYEYLCCPGDLWPNSEFSITLKRNPQKYNILIIMSIFITISSLFVNIIVVSNFRRTFILVFIPLTLIWLQIHVSSKIPVIENGTKLEQIILCCFFTTIIAAFESGIVYCLFENHFKFLNRYFELNTHTKIKYGEHCKNNTIVKNNNIVENNLDYDILHSKIGYFDNGFRFIITLIYSIIIAVLLI